MSQRERIRFALAFCSERMSCPAAATAAKFRLPEEARCLSVVRRHAAPHSECCSPRTSDRIAAGDARRRRAGEAGERGERQVFRRRTARRPTISSRTGRSIGTPTRATVATTAECHVCHGPDGEGSTYAPALVDSLKTMKLRQFLDDRRPGPARTSRAGGESVMPSFGREQERDVLHRRHLRLSSGACRGRPSARPSRQA